MSQLGSDDVGGLWALFAVLDVERDSLSFLQRIELTVRGREMEEDIRTFGLSDETETLFGLFLDCARRHKKKWEEKKLAAVQTLLFTEGFRHHAQNTQFPLHLQLSCINAVEWLLDSR